MKKTLLVRMDKIGDLVVSLNAESHPGLADHQCQWFVAHGLEWVMQSSSPSKNFKSFEKVFSWSSLIEMYQYLRQQRFDQAIVFQAPWFLSFALWLARVPVRAGRHSQWHSFLFFNRGLRQKRSLSEKHESQYNFDLISRATGVAWGNDSFAVPSLQPPAGVENPASPQKPYIVVHPGMMGSALNWPIENYIELVSELSQTRNLVVTGTKADRPWTTPLFEAHSGNAKVLWLHEKLNPKQLLVLLAEAETVVAPSTGIIHLAAALGTRVVGFYSPKRAESKVRWGPLSKNAVLFAPEGDSMSEIKVSDVLTTAFGES